jgi:hypothetical protein
LRKNRPKSPEEVKEEKQKGKAIEIELSKKGRKSEAKEQTRPQERFRRLAG